MISNTDLLSILDDVKELEKTMEQTYRDAATRCTTDKYKKFFQSMAEDECDHSSIVEDIQHIISGKD